MRVWYTMDIREERGEERGEETTRGARGAHARRVE